MEAHICIVATIGLPATGKTTFSRWLLQHPQRDVCIVHICYDDFIKSINDTDEFNYKNQRNNIIDMLKVIVDGIRQTQTIPQPLQDKIAISHNKSNRYIVICDDNNYYRSMRYKLHQFSRVNNLAFGQIYFQSEVNHALLANAKRNGDAFIPENILRKMADRLEPPNGERHLWESTTLYLNTINREFHEFCTMEIILPFLFTVMTNVPARDACGSEMQLQEHNNTARPSLIHQLDIQLRQRIKMLLDSDEQKSTAKLLNEKRKEILQRFKYQHYAMDATDDVLNEYIKLLHL